MITIISTHRISLDSELIIEPIYRISLASNESEVITFIKNELNIEPISIDYGLTEFDLDDDQMLILNSEFNLTE